MVMPSRSLVQRKSGIAGADDATNLDRAIQAGAVQKTVEKTGSAEQLFDILAGKVHPRCPKNCLTYPKAFADKMTE
ncbi:hypothetical protein ACC758_38490, partial [Rhizobium ruizarguesonis]